MRTCHLLLIFVLAVAAVRSATAGSEPVNEMYGYGVNSCGDYLQSRADKNPFQASAYSTWFTGYLTEASAVYSVLYGRVVDFLGDTDINGAAYWMENYCRKYPTAHFASAANEFVVMELRKMDLGAKPK